MIIECPYCATRFRLDRPVLEGGTPPLRCSRCHKLFELPGTSASSDLLLDDADLEWDESESPVRSGTGTGDSSMQTQLFEDSDHVPDDAALDRPFDEEDVLEDAKAQRPFAFGVSVTATLAFLAAVVLAYTAFAAFLRSDPQWTLDQTQALPVVGDEIEAARLGENIALDQVIGRFERTSEGERIFLITGKASNPYDGPVTSIEMEFALLDAEGNALRSQRTMCGNAVPGDLVRDLSMQQVAILRGWGIRPPEASKVGPGEHCPFVSIFLNPPEEVAQFTAAVVRTRRQP